MVEDVPGQSRAAKRQKKTDGDGASAQFRRGEPIATKNVCFNMHNASSTTHIEVN